MCTDFQLKEGQSAIIFADTHVLPPLVGNGDENFWKPKLEQIQRVVDFTGPNDIVCAAGDLFECENPHLRDRLRRNFIGAVGDILQRRQSFFFPGNHDYDENIPGVTTVQNLRINGEGVYPGFDVVITHGDRLVELPLLTYPEGTEMYTEEMYRAQRARVEKNPLLPYAGRLLSGYGWVVDGGKNQDWIKTNLMLNSASTDRSKSWKYLVQGHIHPGHDFSKVQLENDWIYRAVVGRSTSKTVQAICLKNNGGNWKFTRQSSTPDGWMLDDITPKF